MGSPETTTAKRLAALRAELVQARAQAGRFAVWVTHLFVLADLLGGVNVGSGEERVLAANAQGQPVVLGRLVVA